MYWLTGADHVGTDRGEFDDVGSRPLGLILRAEDDHRGSFLEVARIEIGPLDRIDVEEHVLAAAEILDEAEALGLVEELDLVGRPPRSDLADMDDTRRIADLLGRLDLARDRGADADVDVPVAELGHMQERLAGVRLVGIGLDESIALAPVPEGDDADDLHRLVERGMFRTLLLPELLAHVDDLAILSTPELRQKEYTTY